MPVEGNSLFLNQQGWNETVEPSASQGVMMGRPALGFKREGLCQGKGRLGNNRTPWPCLDLFELGFFTPPRGHGTSYKQPSLLFSTEHSAGETCGRPHSSFCSSPVEPSSKDPAAGDGTCFPLQAHNPATQLTSFQRPRL